MSLSLALFLNFLTLLIFTSCGTIGHRLPEDREGHSRSVATFLRSHEGSERELNLSPATPREEAEKTLQKMLLQAEGKGKAFQKHLVNKLFLRASRASLNQEYEFSTLLYRSVLTLSPHDPFLVLKYSRDLIHLGEAAKALSLLEKNYPQSGVYREGYALLLGNIYQGYKKTKKAIKFYKDILKTKKGDTEACLFLTKIYFEDLKDPKRAFQVIRQCQKSDPRAAIFLYYHGKLLVSQGKFKEAERLLRKSLKVDSSFFSSAVILGILLEKRGRMGQAIEVYRNLLEAWPNNHVILARMVKTLFSLEKYGEVLDYAQRLVYLDSGNLNLKVKLSLLYLEKNNYKKAIALLESVHKEVPGSDKVAFYLGTAYRENHQYEKSISFFKKVPSPSILYLESSLQAGRLLSRLAVESRVGRGEERLFNFISERSSGNQKLELELQVLKGQYYELSGRIEEGIEVVERVSSWPDFTDAKKYYLATLQYRVKNYDRSISLLEEVVQNDPQNAHAWNSIGYTYLEREGGEEDLDRAREYIQKAISLDPKNGHIRDSLGWYYYRMGKFKQALKELKRAYDLVQDNSVITKHLALVYWKLNRYDLAERFLVKASQLTKDDGEREEVQKFISQVRILKGDFRGAGQGRHPASIPSTPSSRKGAIRTDPTVPLSKPSLKPLP